MMNNFISISDFSSAVKNKQDIKELKGQTLSPSLQSMLEKQPENDSVEIVKDTEIKKEEPIKENETADINSLEENLQKAKNQNGLIEKLVDKIKGLVGFGLSSKKLDNMLKEVKQGKLSADEFNLAIKKYRSKQENIAQVTGDTASILVAGGAFFAVLNLLTKGKGIVKLNKAESKKYIEKFAENMKAKRLPKFLDWLGNSDKIQGKIDKYSKNGRGKWLIAISSMLIGGFVKENLLKLNRIATKQYKPEINKDTMSKDEIKQAKKEAKKQRKNANFRNRISGMVNGLLLPVTTTLGAFGVPLYLGINALNRHFVAKKEGAGKKGIGSFINDVKDSPITYVTTIALSAAPLFKKAKFSKVLEENIEKTVKKLIQANLETPKARSTVYQELEGIILGDSKIAKIIADNTLNPSEKIKQLSDTNIFALKFKQIRGSEDSLAKALKEECPETWTLEAAQAKIDEVFGIGKYRVQKTVGTGTIAQTFEAEADDGSKVCIKMVHQGIDAAKIERDRAAFEELIKANVADPNEQKFLIANLNNLAQGISAEANLQNEFEAAKELAKVTKQAKVVNPRLIKDNIYVMDRADGISLAALNKFQNCKELIGDSSKKEVEDMVSEAKRWYEYDLERYKDDSRMQKRLMKSKEYYENCKDALAFYDKYQQMRKEIDALTDKESITMLERYQDILIEQFSQVDAKGKTIHGDIHPGNIFIDIKKLKEGKKDFFTLIDTGNTIKQSTSQALRFINLTSYIQNGDYENIASFVLEGATLPKGMTKEKAFEIISNTLKEMFFSDKVSLGIVNNDSILQLTDGIMKDYNIIPASTQGNLLKAKTSANNSLLELMKVYINKKGEKMQNIQDGKQASMAVAGFLAEQANLITRSRLKTKAQEKANLAKIPLAERLKIKRGKNAPKLNSEDFLTYQLKQYRLNDLIAEAKAIIEKLDNM